MTKIARQAKKSLELIHAMIYFAPETADGFAELGLERGRMSYYAGRSAPMGPVCAGVVAATFYNFNPASIARAIPKAWSIAAPQAVLATRLRAADEALRRMLGEDAISSAVVSESAELAREAAQACPPEGKPLYAAHADLEWPDEPHLKLWHAVTLLREFRGDAHIAALQHGGLSGIQALALHSTIAGGFTPDSAKKLRSWSDEQWTRAVQQLRERELVDAEGEITEAGLALREEIETATDAMSVAPWSALGEAGTAQLFRNGGQLSKALLQAGAMPEGLRRTR
ncbi:SCO6745 family protein [Saccharopolyspora sp. 5N708]|uniref:SCO6745 family protein n=1 Tax=Saccharopolyspora sp. 5N708 TaxID=3457424 RepID=UPI003FD343AC